MDGITKISCQQSRTGLLAVTLQNMHIFQGSQGALEVSNKYIKLVFIDYSLVLID
jgi:hypothetical protein